jgi:hypothetical protein
VLVREPIGDGARYDILDQLLYGGCDILAARPAIERVERSLHLPPVPEVALDQPILAEPKMTRELIRQGRAPPCRQPGKFAFMAPLTKSSGLRGATIGGRQAVARRSSDREPFFAAEMAFQRAPSRNDRTL